MYHEAITDSDLYKFTMQWGYLLKYPSVKGKYSLTVRDNREFPDGFGLKLREIIDTFRGISLTKNEKDFMRERCYYLPPAYLDFLEGYRYDPSEVEIKQTGAMLEVSAVGYLYRTVLWEVPLMATISELYFQETNQKPYGYYTEGVDYKEVASLVNKIKAEDLADNNAFYSEFGTRRRYSSWNQDRVIADLKKFGRGHLLGSSNVYYSMMHNLTPMGTVAHEWYMLHAALFGYVMANQMASESWVDVYQGNLGIALPDTFTTDTFLKTFSTKYAKLYDGVRQDSGDPIAFLEKVSIHYQSLRIDPTSKICMFSDNINSIDKVKNINSACANVMIPRYGIGTWFTNHLGVKPLNMVIKLTEVISNGEAIKTIKLSDDPMKNTGDSDTVSLCKKTLKII